MEENREDRHSILFFYRRLLSGARFFQHCCNNISQLFLRERQTRNLRKRTMSWFEHLEKFSEFFKFFVCDLN